MDGKIFSYTINGDGCGQPVDLKATGGSGPADALIWVHLDRTNDSAQQWIEEGAGLTELTAHALLAEETRPRYLKQGDAALLILRGVNLNPGEDPEDMVSLRIWIEEKRIITLRRMRVLACEDLRNSLDEGEGPTGPGDFLVQIVDRLVHRMSDVIQTIEDEISGLEEELIEDIVQDKRSSLIEVRRKAIALRRYLSPQKDILARLPQEKFKWLTEHHKAELREIYDRITRYVEDLDALRERAAVIQDELSSRNAERMNQNMYIISVVAAIFLPLGLLTGLLGINVGGIPGSDTPHAFAIVTFLLVVIALGIILVFKRSKWL